MIETPAQVFLRRGLVCDIAVEVTATRLRSTEIGEWKFFMCDDQRTRSWALGPDAIIHAADLLDKCMVDLSTDVIDGSAADASILEEASRIVQTVRVGGRLSRLRERVATRGNQVHVTRVLTQTLLKYLERDLNLEPPNLVTDVVGAFPAASCALTIRRAHFPDLTNATAWRANISLGGRDGSPLAAMVPLEPVTIYPSSKDADSNVLLAASALQDWLCLCAAHGVYATIHQNAEI